MRSQFKINITGSNPSSLLLSLALVNLDYEIYLYDNSKDINSNGKYNNYQFTNDYINLLKKFDIWNELKEIAYSINSLSIKDSLISKELLLNNDSTNDGNLSNEIAYIIKYSKIKKIIISKLKSYNNFYYFLDNEKTKDSNNFNLEIIFNNFNYNKNHLFRIPKLIDKRYNYKSLNFNVYLRGNINKRLYQINTCEGIITLIPMSKNIYQIFWADTSFKCDKRLLLSKSFLLDNLTVLLPAYFNIDQIIGEVYLSLENQNPIPYIVSNKTIYINDKMLTLNKINIFNYSFVQAFIIQIYNVLRNNKSNQRKIREQIMFKFYFEKIFIFPIIIFLTYFLSKLITSHNIFIIYMRKFLFSLINKISLVKKLLLRYLNYSLFLIMK